MRAELIDPISRKPKVVVFVHNMEKAVFERIKDAEPDMEVQITYAGGMREMRKFKELRYFAD